MNTNEYNWNSPFDLWDHPNLRGGGGGGGGGGFFSPICAAEIVSTKTILRHNVLSESFLSFRD